MRRIKKAKISFLSLCPKGANKLPVLYKSDECNLSTILKENEKFDERGELTAIVYAPDVVDSQGDVASAEVIKDMAYEAARNGLSLDIRHDGKVIDKKRAFIAENFQIHKGDSRFTDVKDYAGKAVDVAGGWAVVLKIDDPELKALYRKGEWNGVSMGGVLIAAEPITKDDSFSSQSGKDEDGVSFPASAYAFVGDPGETSTWKLRLFDHPNDVPNKPSARLTGDAMAALAPGGWRGHQVQIPDPARAEVHAKVSAAHKKATGMNKETPMDPELLKKILAENNAALVAALTPKPPAAPAEPKKDEPPIFKGDPLNLDDVRKHHASVERYTLSKSVDFSDPVALEKHLKALEDAANESLKNETPEQKCVRLEKELAAEKARGNKLAKASTQPIVEGEPLPAGMSKEMADRMAHGRRLAKIANGEKV